MSLQRLLLRTAMVKCLTNKTIAGDLVYDSRMTPVQNPEADQQLPVIGVYTEDDEREDLQFGNMTPNYRRFIDIVLEISVGSFKPMEDGEGQEFYVAQTDPEVEALLDFLETQIWRAINNAVDPDARALRNILKGVKSWTSIAGRAKAEETNVRISARRCVLRCWVANDCLVTQEFDTATAPDEPATLAPPVYANAPYLLPLLTDICSLPQFQTLLQTLSEINGGVDALPPAALETISLRLTNAPTSEPGDLVENIEVPIDVT